MNAKHTPGPWRIQDLQPAIRAGNCKAGPDGTRFRVYGDTTLWLDVVADSDGFVFGENEANARLIAAAPELLEALIEERRVRLLGQESEVHWESMRDLRRASAADTDAAIAKATGGTS